MTKRSMQMLCLLAAGWCLAAVGAPQAVAPAATEQTEPVQDDAATAAYKNVYCPTALEPILPGDYYACEARAAFGRQSYKKMVEMLEESAYWANKDAQYVLGLTYFNGGTPYVPQDRPTGLAWLALAAERKNPPYQLAYAAARSKCTPAEVRQANAAYLKLRVKYGDSVAAPRAIHHFNHAIQPIDDAAREGGIVYLRGFSPFPENAFVIANQLHDQAEADFSTVHGTVVVGKPEWVQTKPANAAQAGDAK